MPCSLQVLRTYCPFWERTVYELWDGFQPVIPANNYLRANLTLSDNTLADKAYALVLFFRFLRRNSLDFFELNQQTLDPFILHFRNELLFRVRRSDAADEIASRSPSDDPIRKLGYGRASSVLAEVGWLCDWWGLVKSRSQASNYRKSRWNSQSRWNSSLPDCFSIRVPKARRKFRDNHVLEANEVEAVWGYLTSEARPQKPRVLAADPFGPKRGWTLARSAAWKRAQHAYRERLAWFHRQQMLWALMIGSGMRRSEVPLLMLDDVQFHKEDLWVSIRTRKITNHLGRAKCGPRTIFIGWDSRIITAWQNWIRSREILIKKWMSTTGNAQHEMFLTNRDGGPLTVDGLQSLFEALNRRFQIFGGEFPEDQFKVHPHAFRHTVEALFEDWGIPREMRQRHLGHKKPETTDLYGKVYRKTYVEILSKLQLSALIVPSNGGEP
jgi:integrase